jgi:hypothetical protein
MARIENQARRTSLGARLVSGLFNFHGWELCGKFAIDGKFHSYSDDVSV